MTTYFTADTHFGHEFMSKLRGFRSAREMDEYIVEMWNANISPGDVVYHLGDFMLPQDTERAEYLLKRLHGTKLLIRGNHERIQTERARQWAWVGDYKNKTLAPGIKVIMFHYALRTWQGMANGSYHLYGHSHGNLEQNYGRSMDVGIDAVPCFSPISLEEILTYLEKRPQLIVDHHGKGSK